MASKETLGAVFNTVGNFSLETFDDRLIIQKTVYMLQAFGLNIGYHFSWYLKGPYSTGLTTDAYNLQSEQPQCLEMSLRFPNREVEDAFNKYMEFMSDKRNDAHRLEIIASVHYLKKQYPKMSNEEILNKLRETPSKASITLEEVNAASSELEHYNLF